MSKKKRRKPQTTPATAPATEPAVSSRWRFFTWMSAFFFLAALVVRLDVITAWPGGEGYALARALDAGWGDYLPAAVNHALMPLGQAIDANTDAVFLFPRLLSAFWLVLAAFFTYRWAGRLFGHTVSQLALLCAGASFFLPFFGKVATADTLALLGHSGMLWTVLLYGLARDKNKLFPFGVFVLLGAIAAPVSTLLLSLMLVVLAVFQRTDYDWQLPAVISVGISCLVLVVQGPQGASTYWFYGQEDSRVLDLLFYGLLGMLPLAGWVVAGVRDLVFKGRQFEQFSLLVGMALVVTLLAQSLLFMFLVALLAGKQMQLYFREPNYPWKDWVKTVSVLHLVLAFAGAFLILAGGGIAFPGAGFRAALGMAGAYWIFSLLGVLGVFGDRRDFALGGAILSGLLTVMFFWVQVYPYLEVERSWPNDLLEAAGVTPSTLQWPDEADESELSTALPYFRQAGWTLVPEGGDYRLEHYPASDTTAAGGGGARVPGRAIVRQRRFGLVPQ
ncbi:hypothetical protein GGR26_002127 [Lewinella marina]|uniref:Glycosyltransferase RgtA/B/C/D-like domain-containing protein n=1 Tax=Neolewinella marina TaxID=438751 RepID=A0A2G0CGR6_9BACT|nr:hypothetical protein [Neolewinella marina]NJB86359.1 hypothetical protein [Neolewinella marina]PHK99173.1 hypothetical protein CGL56_06860 [Neolewinella marina]